MVITEQGDWQRDILYDVTFQADPPCLDTIEVFCDGFAPLISNVTIKIYDRECTYEWPGDPDALHITLDLCLGVDPKKSKTYNKICIKRHKSTQGTFTRIIHHDMDWLWEYFQSDDPDWIDLFSYLINHTYYNYTAEEESDFYGVDNIHYLITYESHKNRVFKYISCKEFGF